jgi:TolA-binding protein
MLNYKFQAINHKQIPMPNGRSQKPSVLFWSLGFRNWILLIICGLCIGFCNYAYALNLDSLKASFLNGDYKQAIAEGEKLLAQEALSAGSDELYYFLGLSYLNDGNYLRACDIFEIILTEFKEGSFRQEAGMGLGDAYFLQGDFNKADDYYARLLAENSSSNLKPELYYRMSQVGLKTGDTQLAKEYLIKLKEEFPDSSIKFIESDIPQALTCPTAFYYTVQVGAFSSINNAKNLKDKLVQRDYPAYIEEAGSAGEVSYRVRVGKLALRHEALELEKKLSSEGYPTKICP